jgi:hypothetical protein
MNRRELLQIVPGAFALAGVDPAKEGVDVTAITLRDEPGEYMLVVEAKFGIGDLHSLAKELRSELDRLGYKQVPILFTTPGVKVYSVKIAGGKVGVNKVQDEIMEDRLELTPESSTFKETLTLNPRLNS